MGDMYYWSKVNGCWISEDGKDFVNPDIPAEDVYIAPEELSREEEAMLSEIINEMIKNKNLKFFGHE